METKKTNKEIKAKVENKPIETIPIEKISQPTFVRENKPKAKGYQREKYQGLPKPKLLKTNF